MNLRYAPTSSGVSRIQTKEYDLDIETKYLWELMADSLIVEPWSDEEVQKAHELRDAQYERDGIDLEEEAY